MSDAEVTDWYNFAVQIALEAGKMMSAGIGKSVDINSKASNVDLVTETDKAVESYLFGEINRRFPSHKTIGEETTSAGLQSDWTDAPTWIIDPVDGTMNFVHTYPFTCVSIGITLNKQVIVGVIYSPFLRKLYTARRGHGAGKCVEGERFSAEGVSPFIPKSDVRLLGSRSHHNNIRQRESFVSIKT